MRDIIECTKCLDITCPPKCFNSHEGSMIALQKLIGSIEREDEIKIYVAGKL